MGVVNRILGRTQTSPQRVERGLGDIPDATKRKGVAGSAGESAQHRGLDAGLKAFEINPWLFASVDLIARTCGLVPWKAYKKSTGAPVTKRQRIAWGQEIRNMDSALLLRLDLKEMEHPALVVLNKPNPAMDSYSFLYAVMAIKELGGACYIYKSRGRDGRVNGLYPMPRTWLSHIPTLDRPYYEISRNTYMLSGVDGMRIPEKDMIVYKTLSARDPYGEGVGLAQIVGAEIDIDEYASTYLGAYFRNSAKPSLLIGIEDADQADLDRAKIVWNEANRGTDNAHRVHWHSGKIDVRELSGSVKDAELVEVRKFERNTILQVSAIPPECLGIIENSNRSTIDAADYHLRKNVIAPRMASLWSVFQEGLADEWPELGGLLCPVNTIPEDAQHKLLAMSATPQAYSINEWRATSGHPPIPGGDKPYIESTYMNGDQNNGDKSDKAGSGSEAGEPTDDSGDD
jgi:HK97 family phage portal protein